MKTYRPTLHALAGLLLAAMIHLLPCRAQAQAPSPIEWTIPGAARYILHVWTASDQTQIVLSTTDNPYSPAPHYILEKYTATGQLMRTCNDTYFKEISSSKFHICRILPLADRLLFWVENPKAVEKSIFTYGVDAELNVYKSEHRSLLSGYDLYLGDPNHDSDYRIAFVSDNKAYYGISNNAGIVFFNKNHEIINVVHMTKVVNSKFIKKIVVDDAGNWAALYTLPKTPEESSYTENYALAWGQVTNPKPESIQVPQATMANPNYLLNANNSGEITLIALPERNAKEKSSSTARYVLDIKSGSFTQKHVSPLPSTPQFPQPANFAAFESSATASGGYIVTGQSDLKPKIGLIELDASGALVHAIEIASAGHIQLLEHASGMFVMIDCPYKKLCATIQPKVLEASKKGQHLHLFEYKDGELVYVASAAAGFKNGHKNNFSPAVWVRENNNATTTYQYFLPQ